MQRRKKAANANKFRIKSEREKEKNSRELNKRFLMKIMQKKNRMKIDNNE